MLIQFNSMADGYRRPKRKIERIQKIRRGRRLAVTRVSLLSNHQLSPAQLDRDSFQLCLWRPSPNETIPGPAAAAAVAVLRAETVQQQFQRVCWPAHCDTAGCDCRHCRRSFVFIFLAPAQWMVEFFSSPGPTTTTTTTTPSVHQCPDAPTYIAQLENEVEQKCHHHHQLQQDATSLSVLLSQSLRASMAHSTGPGNLPRLPPGRLERYVSTYK